MTRQIFLPTVELIASLCETYVPLVRERTTQHGMTFFFEVQRVDPKPYAFVVDYLLLLSLSLSLLLLLLLLLLWLLSCFVFCFLQSGSLNLTGGRGDEKGAGTQHLHKARMPSLSTYLPESVRRKTAIPRMFSLETYKRETTQILGLSIRI